MTLLIKIQINIMTIEIDDASINCMSNMLFGSKIGFRNLRLGIKK